MFFKFVKFIQEFVTMKQTAFAKGGFVENTDKCSVKLNKGERELSKIQAEKLMKITESQNFQEN